MISAMKNRYDRTPSYRKEGGSIGQLYKKLREEFEADKSIEVSRLSLLGTEDEAIVITNISWRKLLPLYSKHNGLLCDSCANYTSAILRRLCFILMMITLLL